MLTIVFDTETTGLPIGRNPSITETEMWPYIVQFSWILYDTSCDKMLSVNNFIIKLDENIDIPEESSNIHGITKEISNKNGKNIVEVLDLFNKDLKMCNSVVGHNISFDKRVIMVESIRNRKRQYFTTNGVRKPEYCTMKNSTDICKIEKISKNGKKYFKYPTQTELCTYLFNEIPKGVHNSLVDILVCLRCFCKLVNNYDIYQFNSTFQFMYNSNCV